jgi:hypothetical protein
LQHTGIIDDECIVISMSFFLKHLFNDIPYKDKIQFWSVIDEEKNQLLSLIVKIAIINNINVIFKSEGFPTKNCTQLTNIISDCGGQSLMIALNTSLYSCYKDVLNSKNSRESKNREVYEHLTFQKVFSARWKEFIDHFDVSFLINRLEDSPTLESMLFLSERTTKCSSTSSIDQMQKFLNKAFIDPDRLTSDVELLETQQALNTINEHLISASLGQTGFCMPQLVDQCKLSSKAPDIAMKLYSLLKS